MSPLICIVRLLIIKIQNLGVSLEVTGAAELPARLLIEKQEGCAPLLKVGRELRLRNESNSANCCSAARELCWLSPLQQHEVTTL